MRLFDDESGVEHMRGGPYDGVPMYAVPRSVELTAHSVDRASQRLLQTCRRREGRRNQGSTHPIRALTAADPGTS